MWELYDLLIDGVSKKSTVRRVVVGETWTSVLSSDGNVGVAMTTNVQTRPQTVSDFVGMTLYEAAGLVKSWNLLEASVGMAAINAYYNTPKRMEELNSRQPNDRYSSFDLDVKGKRVCMVGQLRSYDSLVEQGAIVSVLEREQKDGTYPDSACEYLIPQSNLVIITASAFINKTMPRLLQLSGCGIGTEVSKSDDSSRKVIITGPTAPMAEQLLKTGLTRVAGLVITRPEEMLELSAKGEHISPYAMGERFCLLK